MNEIAKSEWYEELIGNLEAAHIEGFKVMTEDMLRFKHEFGRLILAENANFERSKIYGLGILAQVQKSLEEQKRPIKISQSTLYRMIQFAKKVDDVDKFVLENPTATWYHICTQVLPKIPKQLQAVKDRDEYAEELDRFVRRIEKLSDNFAGDLVVSMLKEIKVKIDYWITELTEGG